MVQVERARSELGFPDRVDRTSTREGSANERGSVSPITTPSARRHEGMAQARTDLLPERPGPAPRSCRTTGVSCACSEVVRFCGQRSRRRGRRGGGSRSCATKTSEPPPPPGVCEDYREWPSVEDMTMFFLVFGLARWEEVGENLLVHYEHAGQTGQPSAASISAIWE